MRLMKRSLLLILLVVLFLAVQLLLLHLVPAYAGFWHLSNERSPELDVKLSTAIFILTRPLSRTTITTQLRWALGFPG